MSVEVTIVCDGCAEVMSGGKTAKAARDALRRIPGITLARRGGKDYCPKCPPEPTPR